MGEEHFAISCCIAPQKLSPNSTTPTVLNQITSGPHSSIVKDLSGNCRSILPIAH